MYEAPYLLLFSKGHIDEWISSDGRVASLAYLTTRADQFATNTPLYGAMVLSNNYEMKHMIIIMARKEIFITAKIN